MFHCSYYFIFQTQTKYAHLKSYFLYLYNILRYKLRYGGQKTYIIGTKNLVYGDKKPREIRYRWSKNLKGDKKPNLYLIDKGVWQYRE